MRPTLLQIAKRLQVKVSELDSFLVPFCHGNIDSHGKKMREDKEAAFKIQQKAIGLKNELDKSIEELVYHL